MISEIVTIIYAIVLIIFLFLWFVWPWVHGGSLWTPAPSKTVKQALELCELKKDDVFYDLGSGFGHILAEASKICDNVTGIEIEPIKYFISKLNARKAKIILGNFFKANLSDATVVFIFQYKGRINNNIGKKLEGELKAGARVVSYWWEIEGWQYEKYVNNLFLYIKK